jgi:sugar phosphate isomerase/epimerase
VLDFARANGFSAVELRGIGQQMDLPLLPEFQPARIARTRSEFAARALAIPCLGSSTNLHEMDTVKHEAELAHARRFIDLAQALGAPYVRVFGNKYVAGVPREAMLAHIAGGLRTLGDYATERGVVVTIESHGDFTDSVTLLELMRRADSPAVGILWDAHHTFVQSREQPETTVAAIKRYIRHVHLKDSVPAGNDRRYVLTGTGEVPVGRQLAALVKAGYRGVCSFEWEKRWHPEIEEPEVAFPQFVEVASRYLREAGVTADGG